MPYHLTTSASGNKEWFYNQSEINNKFYTKTHIDTNYYNQTYINNRFSKYYNYAEIIDMFSNCYTYINNNYYTKDNIDTNYYTKDNIDTNYYDINKIKDIVNKMLNGLKWSDDNEDNTYDENYDEFYAGNVTIQKAIDHLGNTLIRDNADAIKGHKETIEKNVDLIKENEQSIANQQNLIKENEQSIAKQQNFIETNKTEILNKILELKKTVIKNEEQISLNTKEARPLAEVTTKIFNTLAAQANEEISLNTEVIEDNNELLNKTDKNNEADNNVLYVMVTALTAPFIGLSLYYSSDTEENIDNGIEAF